MSSKKDVSTNVDSSFIHNSQEVETVQGSINRQMGKQPWNIPTTQEQKWRTSDTENNMDPSQKLQAEWKTSCAKYVLMQLHLY